MTLKNEPGTNGCSRSHENDREQQVAPNLSKVDDSFPEFRKRKTKTMVSRAETGKCGEKAT